MKKVFYIIALILVAANSFSTDPNRNFLEDRRSNQYSNHCIGDKYEEYEEYEEYSTNDECEYSDEDIQKEDKFLSMYSEYLTDIINGRIYVRQQQETIQFVKELTADNIKLTEQNKYRKFNNAHDGYKFLKELGILTDNDVQLIENTNSLKDQNFINLYIGYLLYVNKGFVTTTNQQLQYIDNNLTELPDIENIINQFRKEPKIKEVIDDLLEKRAELYGEKNIKKRLWFNALNSDDFDKIKKLSNEIDLNIVDNDQNNALHIFTKQGNINRIEWLLKKNNTFINAENTNQDTPLLIAIDNKRYDIVKLLAENGAKVNGSNKQGRIPLIVAAEKGHLDIIKCLIEKGADINSKSIRGLCALENAVYYGFLNIVIYLVEHNADIQYTNSNEETLLTIASMRGHYETFAYLTDQKTIDINHETKQGKTVLFYAIKNFKRQPAILEYALDHGANINQVTTINNKEETPLTIALKLRNLQCVKFLIGRNVHITQSALDIANQQQIQNTVDILVKAKEKQQALQ